MSQTIVARLSPAFVEPYKTKKVPWGPLGYITYKRTYARHLDLSDHSSPKEEWWQTVHRCVDGALAINARLTKEEAERLYDHVFNLRCSFSGRALWQLGTKYVERNGQDSLNNCWFVTIGTKGSKDPSRPFCFLFDELMMGGGVGFSIHPRHVYEFPDVEHSVQIIRRDERDVDFIVPDNREGWVELLKRVFDAFFFTGKDFVYSAHCIRGRGSPIKGFGGTASGPVELCNGMDKIATILRSRVGRKLRPIDCLDIANICGHIVKAGNVRRSAQVAIGKKTDVEFLWAKNWERGSVPAHRGQSNNSVFCGHIDELSDDFWVGYEGTGEPYGLANLTNAQRYGRIADGLNYRPDPKVSGGNPCMEIFLAPYEACNLADIFLPRCSQDQFLDCALLLYKVSKAISCLPATYPESQQIIEKHRRIGIGVAGFLQVPEWHEPEIFTKVYRALEQLDREWSKELGVNQSIKLTAVKPGGTLPLLPGVLSGAGPGFAEYLIRRIRFGSDDPLIEICRKHGYHIEPEIQLDGSRNLNVMVVDFPIAAPLGSILAKDLTAVQHLEHVAWLQEHWSDNSVSVSVYYRKEELPEIKQWLRENYHTRLKAVSFVLHKDHGFVQAPLEEITEEQFHEMSSKLTPITDIGDVGSALIEDLSCDKGGCPTR